MWVLSELLLRAKAAMQAQVLQGFAALCFDVKSELGHLCSAFDHLVFLGQFMRGGSMNVDQLGKFNSI
jgi:hypothetical protein